ncbi:transposase [Streptomyces sp. NBC_00728]|uniref:transposase n=1 Tax=Streptomyces sp. NBC_00728 TaxID=2903676 RepID=UPI00386A4566
MSTGSCRLRRTSSEGASRDSRPWPRCRTRSWSARTQRQLCSEALQTIPGIGRLGSEIIIAETGGDVAQFASAHHLASWIGVCPGQNESAGVSKSGRTRPGNANLKCLLGVAAMVAIRNKGSYLGVFFRRLTARRGGKRALVAVMRKLVIAVWHVLHDHEPYRDLGADHFTRRDPERAMRRMLKEANSLGLTIRFDPIPA